MRTRTVPATMVTGTDEYRRRLAALAARVVSTELLMQSRSNRIETATARSIAARSPRWSPRAMTGTPAAVHQETIWSTTCRPDSRR